MSIQPLRCTQIPMMHTFHGFLSSISRNHQDIILEHVFSFVLVATLAFVTLSTMADPESPAPKPKRKRCTTTSVDTGEMTEMIMDELEKARERIDRRLTKYNDSILQAQSAKRQRFIDYCESEIGGLPGGLRSSLATSLLSSEDFAVKMNFSELHTSSAKSHLTWSCGDASLSDPSWRKGELNDILKKEPAYPEKSRR